MRRHRQNEDKCLKERSKIKAHDEPEYNDVKRYLTGSTYIKHFKWSFPSVAGTVLEEQLRNADLCKKRRQNERWEGRSSLSNGSGVTSRGSVTDTDSSDVLSDTRPFKRTAMSTLPAEENRAESAESRNQGEKPLICEFGMPVMRIQNLDQILYLIPEIEPMYKIQSEISYGEMEKLVEQQQRFCSVIPAVWSCTGFKSSISSLIKNRTSTPTQLIKRLLAEEVKTRNRKREKQLIAYSILGVTTMRYENIMTEGFIRKKTFYLGRHFNSTSEFHKS